MNDFKMSSYEMDKKHYKYNKTLTMVGKLVASPPKGTYFY